MRNAHLCAPGAHTLHHTTTDGTTGIARCTRCGWHITYPIPTLQTNA